MTDWATVADVKTYTGVVVTADEIPAAQAIIELFCGTTTQASDEGLISSRNLRLLAMAVAYQCVWMRAHPDVYTNVDIDGGSQDGAAYTLAHANAGLLAPLAKRCVDRLSWRVAPMRARPARARLTLRGDRNSAVRDDAMPWLPL